MKNFTSLLKARIFNALFLGSFFLSATLISSHLFAQNGSPCYKPIIGPGTSATAVGAGVTIGFSTGNGITNLTNGNTGDFAEINNLAALVAAQGVGVANANVTYPAGWHAGFVVQFGNSGLLNANILGGIQLQTFDNGSPRETRTLNTGIGVTLIAGSSDKVYLNFKTTQTFDEVRLVFTTAVNASLAASTLKIYYATAFDPACGTLDNNSICEDQIAGNQTVVNYGAGTLGALSALTNPQNITDGDKKSYASLVLPAGTDLTADAPYVGVKSLQTIYASGSGRRVGFVIQKQSTGILSADVLSSLRIQTFLHGELQEDVAVGGATALVGASALSGVDPIQKISIPTTLNYNEVRLVVAQTASINVGTLRIYYAFESGAACTECEDVLAVGGTYPSAAIVGSRTGGGICGLATVTVNNTDRVTDDFTDGDYATIDYTGVVGLGCDGSISVRTTPASPFTVIPANAFAGFVISKTGSLIDLDLLGSIRIRTYLNGSPRDDSNNGGLLGLSLLSTGTGQTKVGIKTTQTFDEIRITVDFGLVSTFLTTDDVRVYYAFVQRDDDNDGVYDCNEICGASDDSVDSDGDGTPDACDACNTANQKSATIDTDGDGLFNNCDPDSDNDGIPDAIEDTDTDGDPNNNDADGDGVPNYLDLDSDNDGLLDLYEAGFTKVQTDANDANSNGVLEGQNPISTNTPKDTDGDGIPDYLDLDSDNDSIFDLYEGGVTDYVDNNNDGVVDGPDADNDGIQDSVDNADGNFGSPETDPAKDQDVDGVPDFRDLDSDNDGINDIIEGGKTGLVDANNDGIVDGPDADGDGIRDSADSDDIIFGSPGGTPPVDTDGDGVPDNQDLDSDNDSVSDLVESGQTGYSDTDDDGVVDAGTDTDGDGIQDSVDGNTGAFGDAGSPAPKNTDSANDNIPDYRDPDSDNDGTNDIDENGRGDLDDDNDGKIDNPEDPDGDGIANNDGLDFKPDDFGGLGNGAPDLQPVINSNGSTFNTGVEKDVVIAILNKGATVTKNPLVFEIQKLAPVYTITVDASATTTTLVGATPNNTEWTIVDLGNRYQFTLKDGFSILPTGNKQIVIKVTAGTFKGGSATVVAQITEGTGGGETPTTNNITNYTISINQ